MNNTQVLQLQIYYTFREELTIYKNQAELHIQYDSLIISLRFFEPLLVQRVKMQKKTFPPA